MASAQYNILRELVYILLRKRFDFSVLDYGSYARRVDFVKQAEGMKTILELGGV